MRQRLQEVVEASWFQWTITGLILINAAILGLETSPAILAEFGTLLYRLDAVILGVFVAEIVLRLAAHRWAFFKDPWGWFDLIIVVIALVPASGPFAVLRVMRVLRVLRLISIVPSLRRVVTGLLRALPGMASIGALLSLLMYVAGVMATKLFQERDPTHFGNLGESLFTLFQVMTADAWASAIARPIVEAQPMAALFFVLFILASTFITLNLFIAVAVEALPSSHGDKEEETEKPAQSSQASEGQEAVLAELRALRSEVAELRDRVG